MPNFIKPHHSLSVCISLRFRPRRSMHDLFELKAYDPAPCLTPIVMWIDRMDASHLWLIIRLCWLLIFMMALNIQLEKNLESVRREVKADRARCLARPTPPPSGYLPSKSLRKLRSSKSCPEPIPAALSLQFGASQPHQLI